MIIFKMIDDLLLDSRLTPNGNGTSQDKDFTPPTSGQKWWISVIIGLLFALCSNRVVYQMTDYIVQKSSVGKLLLHTVFFIVIMRLIMW